MGFEQVDRSLREIRLADRQHKSSKQSKVLSDNKASDKSLKKSGQRLMRLSMLQKWNSPRRKSR